MRPTMLARATAAGLILAAAAAGCGERRPYAPVSGQIRLDGKPLAGAGVAFEPVAAPGAIDAEAFGSYGTTDAQGRFKLTGLKGQAGAAVGPHRVAVRKPRKPGAEDGGGETLPAKYNVQTELTFTVPAGGTDAADFNLSAK